MESIKTKGLGRKHFEHLEVIGLNLTDTIDALSDSPYVLISDKKVLPCASNKQYKEFAGKELTKESVLKMRPEKELEQIKKQSKKVQLLYKLMKKLNTVKVSSISGYDVSWTIQETKNDNDRYEILPISPNACGSISMEHLEVVLEFSKEYPMIYPTLSYTDWNGEKKRYGTSKPCIYFY